LDNLQLYIESLVFASPKVLTQKDIKAALEAHFDSKFKDKELAELLEALTQKYVDDSYPFEIVQISGGFQFMTKGAFYPLLGQHLKLESKKKLSKAAMETLAIISYKQPTTKSGMEAIRGVNCDYSVQKLLDKELIEIRGRAEGPGRPLLYGTSEKFMNHFGLKTLADLPKVKEFAMGENEIGLRTDDLPEPNPEIVGSEKEVMEIQEEDVPKIETSMPGPADQGRIDEEE